MKKIVLLTIIAMSGSAWAQCAGPSLGSSNPGCSIPIDDPSSPYYSPNSEIPSPVPQPIGEWVKTWGAIADGTNGVSGAAVGKMSRKEAEKVAVDICIKEGGVGCKPVYPYENRCISISQGLLPNSEYTISRMASSSIERSSRIVLEDCNKRGAKDCKVYYSACTEPVFRHY